MKLKIGTRGSPLALWQASFVKSQIEAFSPELNIEIEIIKTSGDKLIDTPLSEIGGKGVFIKEIDEALILKKVDIAVHSLKDVPSILPSSLQIGAYIKRQDPSDVLVSKNGLKIDELSDGSKIGTGSLRRKSQILGLYPHLDIVPIRGNVDTRVNKLNTENLDGVVLAAAGLVRMGLEDKISQYFDPDFIVPAPCQGVISVHCRKDDTRIVDLLSEINDTTSEVSSNLERSFLNTIGADCNVPAACYAKIEDNTVVGNALISDIDGKTIIRNKIKGRVDDSFTLGAKLATEILDNGGLDILESLN